MPCERDMKYVDQLPNGYVFVEEGKYAPARRIMAQPENHLHWVLYDDAMEVRYDPRRHKVLAAPVDRPVRTEW